MARRKPAARPAQIGRRRIEYRPLDSLRPNPANPKEHDLDGIESSYERFGMIEPIVEDGRTGYIVSGHGRTDTLRQQRDAGDDPPDGVEDRDGVWYAPVVVGWASRTDAEAEAATVLLNATPLKGGWNRDMLLDQLDRLAAGPGLDGVGLDTSDIDDLLAARQETQLADDGTGEWLQGDADRQVRSLMLDLPLDDYRWAAQTCARARDAYGVDSNAALFLVLLEEDDAA